MALINSQTIIEGGDTPTLTTLEATSNTFSNGGTEFIMIKNDSGSSVTVTVTAVTTSVENPIYGDLEKNDATTVVADGNIAFMGTFPVTAYNGTDGICTFTVSAHASVRVGILTIG